MKHLNVDLFGNHIPEEPKAVPVSVRMPEYIDVYHAGYGDAPHLIDPTDMGHSGNTHADIIHAGTYESAMDRGGSRRKHVYRVPKSLLTVTYRDSDAPNSGMDYGDYYGPSQLGLWEGTEIRGADLDKVAQGNVVVPYRNQFEDKGSLSYMLPKRLINTRKHTKGSGKIEYLGYLDHPRDPETGRRVIGNPVLRKDEWMDL
jgi:hypothetical protein